MTDYPLSPAMAQALQDVIDHYAEAPGDPDPVGCEMEEA